MALPITITDAGRAEIINAQNTGTGPVTITEIGFGTGQYTPTKTRTALQAQVKRVSSIAGQAVAADTIHVMALDESSAAYNVGEFGLFSDKGTLIAVYSQPAASGWIIQKAGPSTLLLATDIILESLNATSLTFGDVTFINPPATTTTPGVVQLNDTLTSPSTSQALTAAMGKKLQDEKQPKDATLTALAALITAADKLIYATGSDTFATTALTAFARSLLDDLDATSARATLGLGSAAQKATSDFVSTSAASTISHAGAPLLTLHRSVETNAVISLGHLLSTVFIGLNRAGELRIGPTADVQNAGRKILDAGDTTAFTLALLKKADAASAREDLQAQKQDATLDALAALGTAANQLIYTTGVDSFATATLTAFARTLLDDADAAAARATLGAQQQDATLTALASIVTAADKLIYATGSDTFATTDLTAFARTLLDDADAAAARSTLGLGSAAQKATGDFVSTSAGSTIYHTGAPLLSLQRNANTNAVMRIAHSAAEAYLGLSASGELRVGPSADVSGQGNTIFHGGNIASAFPKLLGANGWVQLPGGLIVQWGSSAKTVGGDNSVHSETFPLAFPAACLAVIPGTITNVATGVGSQRMAQLVDKALTGFIWFSDSFESGSGPIGVTYIAIGY